MCTCMPTGTSPTVLLTPPSLVPRAASFFSLPLTVSIRSLALADPPADGAQPGLTKATLANEGLV